MAPARDAAVVDAEEDPTAVGVREGDDRGGEVVRRDRPRLELGMQALAAGELCGQIVGSAHYGGLMDLLAESCTVGHRDRPGPPATGSGMEWARLGDRVYEQIVVRHDHRRNTTSRATHRLPGSCGPWGSGAPPGILHRPRQAPVGAVV